MKAGLVSEFIQQLGQMPFELAPPGIDDLKGDADPLSAPFAQGAGIALIGPDEF